MVRILHISLFCLLTLPSFSQSFIFKIRRVPELKYFVFTDGYNNHNLDTKVNSKIDFPKKLYIQIYENDTFLIRWSNWELSEANAKLDYLKRDSLTFAGKVTRQGKDGMKFTFPFEEDTYNMFTMSEEPLIQIKNYKTGPPNEQEKRVKLYFVYNKKTIVIADIEERQLKNNSEIKEVLKLSKRIKLGFYSNDLYSDKTSKDLPLNIVNTYPVDFILDNANTCDEKLYWNALTTTKTLNFNDSTTIEEGRKFIDNLPKDVFISLNGNDVEYYSSRRYVYLENDSQIYVSNLNRGCEVFNDSLSKLDSIPVAEYFDARDGINNYLVKIDSKRWGWASKYGCNIEWRIYEEKTIKKLLKLDAAELFKKLIEMKPKNQALLNETCE